MLDPVDRSHVRRAGLLVGWRRTGTGWEGRVVYLARLRSDAWVLVEEWVADALVVPAGPAAHPRR
ncbi:MAG: hypothetical protein WB441_02310 [Nocardioidaceae bacterium]